MLTTSNPQALQNNTLLTAHNMTKKLSSPPSDSSLSPVADDLIAQVESNTAPKIVLDSKKRKANSTEANLTKRTKKAAALETETVDVIAEATASPRSKRHATHRVKVDEDVVEDKIEIGGNGDAKVTKKTTTITRKKKKEVDSSPIEKRTKGHPLMVGAHVSGAGGVQNSLVNIVAIGGNAFALFLKNQRKWDSPTLDPETVTLFTDNCKKHGFEVEKCCLPHGSYLVNLAHPDPERKKQAYDSFHDDLTRCHKLGIKLYNFHPGNANATTREEGIRLIAENINQAHRDPATGEVVAVLETMATLGNTIGGTFKDIAEIINLVDNKDRVGVCLDTCHVFAAGYDLRTPETYTETMKKFDKEIGLEFLKALHVNDSKAPFFSNRDLHARIGTGYLGLRAFHNLVNDERLHGLPMVLETPVDVVGEDGKKFEDKSIWAREIKMLEKLVGMDVESTEFKELEAKLHKEGEAQRKETGDAFERKQAKTTKSKATKAKAKSTDPKAANTKAAASRMKKSKKVEKEDDEVDDV